MTLFYCFHSAPCVLSSRESPSVLSCAPFVMFPVLSNFFSEGFVVGSLVFPRAVLRYLTYAWLTLHTSFRLGEETPVYNFEEHPGARVPSEICSPCNLRVSPFFKVVTFPPLFLTCSTVTLKGSCLSLLVNAYTVFFSLPSKDPLNKNNTIWIQSILSFFVDFIARVLSHISFIIVNRGKWVLNLAKLFEVYFCVS